MMGFNVTNGKFFKVSYSATDTTQSEWICSKILKHFIMIKVFSIKT